MSLSYARFETNLARISSRRFYFVSDDTLNEILYSIDDPCGVHSVAVGRGSREIRCVIVGIFL